MSQGKAFDNLQAARDRFADFRAEQLNAGVTGTPFDPASGLTAKQWAECMAADRQDEKNAELERIRAKVAKEGEDALTDSELLRHQAHSPRAAMMNRHANILDGGL
jgi:hypothetical protein